MWPAFEQALTRHREVEAMLGDSAVIADRARYTKLAKEHGALQKTIKPYLEFLNVTKEIEQAKSMLDGADDEMKAFVAEEMQVLTAREAELRGRLEDILLMGGEDYGSIIMEIRAGTGGDEAAIFAGDLYRMYSQYAREHGWKIEDISFSPGEQGGYKEIIFGVSGEDAFQHLKYESGGHRVQRVPKTETQGRIHTSAATVAVMPEPDEVQVEIDEAADIEWERMRAGGAGGQHVNKTESAVRIWYKKGTPDEFEVKCQDERSQSKNYDRAMRILRSRVFERQQERLHKARADQRKSLIGSGDRSERIRTYNFPQNRVTDHRINESWYKLDTIVAGSMGDVIGALRAYDKKQRLEGGMGKKLTIQQDRSMLSFLFWNLNGTGGGDRASAMKLRLGRIATHFDVDIFLFAESNFSPAELAIHLSNADVGKYWHSASESDRIQIFTRLAAETVRPQFDNVDGRLTIRRISAGTQEILLAAVHLRSQLHQSEDAAGFQAIPVRDDIANEEESLDNYNTIVVGDLNMNPFSHGMVASGVFHSAMTKVIAAAGDRTVAGRRCRYFYNPMWSHFGDRSPGPPGTYFYSASSAIEYHWHIFDQVLLRPTLMNALRDLRILDSDGDESLLDQHGRPDKKTASDHLPILFRVETTP